MNTHQQYVEASIKTSDNLRHIARSDQLRDLSQLSLPEINAIVDLVAQVAPAGNVPGVILNGLARLSDRRPPAKIIRRDVNLLFKGVEKALDKAVYSAFFAGPAAVIWSYQNILKLAGKDPENSFPEGIWQFYLDYALREDTARHTCETHGFDTLLKRHHIHLSPVDRITAWIMTAIHCLHQYNDFLANEWRERTYTYLLQEVTSQGPDAAHYAQLYRRWAAQRPYGRNPDADSSQNYAAYRRHKFDQFLVDGMRHLDNARRREWLKRVQAASGDMVAYQQQLSILAYLDPGSYGETRVPISLSQAQVGVIYQGRYYLIPVYQADTAQPTDVTIVRAQIAALLAQPAGKSAMQLSSLARIQRAALADLRHSLNKTLVAGLGQLQLAPILINIDPRPRHLPLAELRQAERGVGDHPLTLFDTGETFVFDQSHIFFDSAWGAALAEIMTREALSWAVYLHTLPPAQPGATTIKPLKLPFETGELRFIEAAPQVVPDVSVETDGVKLQPILALRKLFKQRSDLLDLTVNDLLILYRALHAVTYRLHPTLVAELQKLGQERRFEATATAALAALSRLPEVTPALLIPLDATRRVPRDRVYPLVFEVPLRELDLLAVHTRTIQALEAYEKETHDRSTVYGEFDQLQRTYLATLAGFGQVLSKAKEIAITGESASASTLKLLAHIPAPLQHLFNKIPNRFDVLNDLIKGREVFTNVGAVARASTLLRFSTAKDDGEKKSLAWGVITDAEGIMRITLRDCRPHVSQLMAIGQKRLASNLAQHYLDTYAQGVNDYIRDLRRITAASRETQLARPHSAAA